METALIFRKCDRNQDEDHDENNALLVFGEFEYPERALHRRIAQLFLLNFGTPLSSFCFLRVVILSEAKNLNYFS
ncbi:MAG TPA: hypothetical protein VFQ83_09065 [Candidatus Udaeobacter sp.]|nr:hypothetical protein [Candidatus Udaeobacter sp.]